MVSIINLNQYAQQISDNIQTERPSLQKRSHSQPPDSEDKWGNSRLEELADLGWPSIALRKIRVVALWDQAEDVFVDKSDATLNFVLTDSIRSFHSDGTGWTDTGTSSCTVFSNNHASVTEISKANTSNAKKHHISPQMVRAWKTARPWLLENLSKLQSRGWSRKALFRADRLTYPHGKWGPAWCSNWLREGVELHIEHDGSICWKWTQQDGQQVSQRMRPQN